MTEFDWKYQDLVRDILFICWWWWGRFREYSGW